MAEIRTPEGLVVGLIEPTTNEPKEDKSEAEKLTDNTATKKTSRGKRNDG